jgi:hypothetical protein
MPDYAACISCVCGAKYERSTVLLPIKDVGEFACTGCGNVMERWRGRLVPTFKRIETPETGEGAGRRVD